MSDEEVRELVDTISKEEFPYALAIAKAYEKLEQENQQLKEQLHEASLQIQEMIEQDIECPSNCSKIEGYKNNWNELKNWCKENQYIGKTITFENDVTYTEILNKMRELEKGNSEQDE